jgi:hypothetical protein
MHFIFLDSKPNSNSQSILNKLLEKQLEQCTVINTLNESNEEIKREILENRTLLQNILPTLTMGPSAITTDQLQQKQGEKPKQRLKRRDTKHMWWDVSVT